MTYTAEQLRAKARNLRELGRQLAADDCEAHADALEENARLKREMKSLEQALTDPENQPSQFGTVMLEWHEAELAKLRQHAEAMANDLDRFAAQPDYDGQLYGPMPSLIAYRADFPEEK